MSEELSNTIRAAIHSCGKRLPTIAKKSGVEASALTDFMDGADIHLTSASKLAAYLGLDLIVEPRPAKKKAKKA
jgi:hypothetical protein